MVPKTILHVNQNKLDRTEKTSDQPPQEGSSKIKEKSANPLHSQVKDNNRNTKQFERMGQNQEEEKREIAIPENTEVLKRNGGNAEEGEHPPDNR